MSNQNNTTHNKYYNKKHKNSAYNKRLDESIKLIRKPKTKKVLSSMDEIEELNSLILNVTDSADDETFKTIDLGSSLLLNIGKAVSESVTKETNDLISDIELDIMNRINNDEELNDVKVNLSNTLMLNIKDAVSDSLKQEEDDILLEIENNIMNKLTENKKLENVDVSLSDTMVSNVSNLMNQDIRDNELLEKIELATKNRLEELENSKEVETLFDNDFVINDNLNNLFVNLDDNDIEEIIDDEEKDQKVEEEVNTEQDYLNDYKEYEIKNEDIDSLKKLLINDYKLDENKVSDLFENIDNSEEENFELPITDEDIDAFVRELEKTNEQEKIEVYEDDTTSFEEDLNNVIEFSDPDYTYDLGKHLILNLNETVNDSLKSTTRRILNQVEKKTEEIINNIKFELKDEDERKEEELEKTLELEEEKRHLEELQEEELRLNRIEKEKLEKTLEMEKQETEEEVKEEPIEYNKVDPENISHQEQIRNMDTDPNYVPFDKLRDRKLDEKIESHMKKVSDNDLVRSFHLSYEKRMGFLAVMLIVFCILSIVFLKNSYVETKEDTIRYDESSSVNYEVYLKENDFYDKKFLTKTDYNNKVVFIASIIDHIKVNFQYVFNIDEAVDVDFTYDIDAKLTIENGSGGVYYESIEKLVENKTVSLTHDKSKAFIEPIEINYDEYNKKANDFRAVNGVNTDSTLLVYMTIHKKNDSTRFKFVNGDDTQVMNLSIPLSQKQVKIELDYKDFNTQSNILRVANRSIGNTACFILFIIFSILAFGLLIVLAIMTSYSLNRVSKYDKEVNRILKDYDTSIVNTDSLPDMEGKTEIKINKFIELLDLHDNLKLPIIYCNVVSHQKCHFYIEHDNKLYLYTIKNLETKK